MHDRALLTSRASITVPTPTVKADLGTCWTSLLKKRALARMVSCARVFTRVRETRLDPKYRAKCKIFGRWTEEKVYLVR